MKNFKGFTLVEAIVVAVIMLILAAISIPMYSGFVDNAKIDSAKSICELVGAAVIQTHNRGVDIAANTWGDIGINNPSDATWAYTFQALSGSAAMAANYSITATNVGIGNVIFYPAQSGSNRWSLP